MAVKIFDVKKKSICAKKGIKAGDTLLSINGNEINDVLDYRFYGDEAKLELSYVNSKNRVKKCTLKNAQGCDSLGLEFETYLMDKHRHCRNSCIFCFIDQLPEGLRKSLYFKDDDSRLSFLFGNYITLTNLSEGDVERIIRMHISPVNVSVHTMNEELRVKMMRNPDAGKVLGFLNRFSEAGIEINAQLVLCPGINDGDELLYSLEKLSELKSIRSIAAVPVGLTKYREKLYSLSCFDEKGAADVIDIIDNFNARLIRSGREKTAYPADEFFILAKREFPEYEYYGDFPQLDNGVGSSVLLENEFMSALNEAEADTIPRHFALVTGMAAYPLIKKIADNFCKKFSSSRIDVYGIVNTFFGEKVTVTGLLTGKEIIDFFRKEKLQTSELLLPSVMFKSEEELIFLDDVTLADVENELNVNVSITTSDGYSLFDTFYNKH